MLHRILLDKVGLHHLQSPEEDKHGRNESETEGHTPDNAEMIISKAVQRRNFYRKCESENQEDRRRKKTTYIQSRTSGTKAATTKPASIIESIIHKGSASSFIMTPLHVCIGNEMNAMKRERCTYWWQAQTIGAGHF